MEHLAKRQKVSKYHKNDSLENFSLLFMSLSTSKIDKTVIFGRQITLSF